MALPSVYIAFSTFHPELIPTVLLLAIINSREGIPFPAVFEAFIMEFFFELLREAGIRLPRPVGSAVSIVGALVIGEAAINAGIASPIMVIIVALSGIASFAVPQYNFGHCAAHFTVSCHDVRSYFGHIRHLDRLHAYLASLGEFTFIRSALFKLIGPFIPTTDEGCIHSCATRYINALTAKSLITQAFEIIQLAYSGENNDHEKADMDIELKLIGTFRLDRLLGSGRAS